MFTFFFTSIITLGSAPNAGAAEPTHTKRLVLETALPEVESMGQPNRWDSEVRQEARPRGITVVEINLHPVETIGQQS